MKRLALVLGLALASICSVACTASSEPDEQGDVDEVKKSEDPLQNNSTTLLTCNRWKNGGCATLQTWCNNHGRDLKCDLNGNCYCAPAAEISRY